jgi:hypothetical protein
MPVLHDLQVVLVAGHNTQRGWQRHIESARQAAAIDVPSLAAGDDATGHT